MDKILEKKALSDVDLEYTINVNNQYYPEGVELILEDRQDNNKYDLTEFMNEIHERGYSLYKIKEVGNNNLRMEFKKIEWKYKSKDLEDWLSDKESESEVSVENNVNFCDDYRIKHFLLFRNFLEMIYETRNWDKVKKIEMGKDEFLIRFRFKND